MLQSNRRILILAGLLGIVLTIVGQAITLGAPTIDEGGGEMATWLSDNRTLALSAGYLCGLGLALTLPLVIALYSRLRIAEGGTALMSGTFLIAAVAALAVVTLGIGMFTAAAYRADTISGETAGLLTDLTYASLSLAAFPTAVAFLAAGWVIIQRHALATWLGYLALAASAIHLVAAAGYDTGSGFNLQNAGGIGAIAYYVVLLLAGVLLLRQTEEEATAVSLAAAAALGEMGTMAPGGTQAGTSSSSEHAAQGR